MEPGDFVQPEEPGRGRMLVNAILCVRTEYAERGWVVLYKRLAFLFLLSSPDGPSFFI